ncbi:Annexin (Annexin) Family [Phytophthora cinnamomi]|uniref:Annexin (Annexin) Family n=1 Tax=Phytophthora cinnamomi TaxID=4785 RepID=UPI003559C7F9|nr:Annexin (Annexin) Family [Phytophthora cinnamomi]
MTLELYPASVHNASHGTAVQYPSHIDEAVQQIHGACQGLGTDEKTLIAVLGSKSPESRNLIALRYKELYRQPLKSLLKSETSGDFGRLLRMISTPLPETEAQILRDATKGMGTTESLIVQILSGRSNEEMNILKRTYFDMVGKDLAVTLNSELSGDFRKVVMAVLQSSQVPYNPTVHNAAKAEEEATALYKAGQGRLGTNEEVFIGILVKAPPDFLKMMDAVYVAKYNNNIVKAVDKEFSGDAKKSLNYLVRSTIDPYPAIAEVFEKTMKGFGTDETGLSTALVRYQSVLPHVKTAYKKLYHEELRDRISGETSGDYKKLLLEVFDAPQDLPRSKVGSGGAAYSSGVSATTGASSPAYLSTQTSYAASTTSLHSPGQAYTPSPAYPTPAGQQRKGIQHQVAAATQVKPPLKVKARRLAILLPSSSLDTRPSSSKQVILLLNNSSNNRRRGILDNSSNMDTRSQDTLANNSNRDTQDNNNQDCEMNDSRRSRLNLHTNNLIIHFPLNSSLADEMKQSQFVFVLLVTAMLESACAVSFDWQPEAAVEIPENGAINPVNMLRRMQVTTELLDTETATSASATGNSASASTLTTETEAPTTIMVRLPDNFASSSSGSGSVMFFDGSISGDDKNVSKSVGSGSATDEVSGAASKRNSGVMLVLTAFVILSTLVLA